MTTLAIAPVVATELNITPVKAVTTTTTTTTTATLPSGFPAQLESRLAWTASQFANEESYVYNLNSSELAEISAALEAFKTLGLDGTDVNRDNFALPTLGPVLESVSKDLYDGKGFSVIRGIKPSDYSVADLTTIWLGLQSHVADQRGRQDKRGNMMVHIVPDDSNKEVAEHHRHSNKAITFHNEEAGDIISWLTRNTATQGGKCIIAPAYTVYNVLAATRPDLIRVLARPDWPFALPQFHCRPVLHYHDSKLIINFGRAPLLGNAAHPRPADMPSVTAQQAEALDAIESVARAVELQITTRPGDLHFVNNLAVLHRRDGFSTSSSSGERRHLVRMRLRSSQHGWSIPPSLDDEWLRAFKKAGPRAFHIEPQPAYMFPLRKQPN